MGDGSPGSHEAEGESGEGFYISRSGSKFDLLVILGASLAIYSVRALAAASGLSAPGDT